MTDTPRLIGDQESLRQVNLTAVLNCIRQKAPLSRAALAEMTGLNKATITRIIRDLIDHGFVRETGFLSSATGRPSIMLEMDPDGGYILGARLDVDGSTIIVTNFAAEIIWRHEIGHSLTDSPQTIQDNLLNLIQQAHSHVPATNRPILGLGLSLPGLVDVSSGTLLFAPNLGWNNVPFRKWLRSHFSFPIYADNEANLAALGESYFGAARNSDYVLYINITAGVGGGIVLNQQILPGTSGLAGEVGHMTIDPNGPRCNCGNHGCWETYIALPVLFRRVRDAISPERPSLLSAEVLNQLNQHTVPLLVQAAEKGDQAALVALQETGRYIGIGLANLINVFNPQRVVLGGYLNPAYGMMLPGIRKEVSERALRWSREATEIIIAQYGSDASLMGAIATIYNHVLSFPTEVFAQSVETAGIERR
jgi:glucokinase-like ROK family protein